MMKSMHVQFYALITEIDDKKKVYEEVYKEYTECRSIITKINMSRVVFLLFNHFIELSYKYSTEEIKKVNLKRSKENQIIPPIKISPFDRAKKQLIVFLHHGFSGVEMRNGKLVKLRNLVFDIETDLKQLKKNDTTSLKPSKSLRSMSNSKKLVKSSSRHDIVPAVTKSSSNDLALLEEKADEQKEKQEFEFMNAVAKKMKTFQSSQINLSHLKSMTYSGNLVDFIDEVVSFSHFANFRT